MLNTEDDASDLVGHTADPAWVASLKRAMGEDHQVSERLPLGVLTEEVEHWCARGRVESWKRLLNPNSLHDDIQDTLKALGPALHRDLAPSVEAFAAAAQCLDGKPAPTAEQTAALRLATGALRSDLPRASAIEATWRDHAWKAAEREDLELLQWRIVCLRDLLELVGRDPRYAVTDARLALGGADAEDDDALTEQNTLTARLDAVGRKLSMVPPAVHCVVWLAYENASLESFTDEADGPVALYEVDWAVPNAMNEDGRAFEHRDELRQLLADWGGASWLDLYDPNTGSRNWIVLARVDLGLRTPHGALEAANQVVQTMVRVAAFQWDGSPWTRTGPASLIADGHVRSTSYAFGICQPG